MNKIEPLKIRYYYKLTSNILVFIINIAIQAIIPRGLGPKLYGDYNFLTSTINQIFGFLDMGVSTCFYTRLSKKQDDKSLVIFYFYFCVIVSLITLLLIVLSHLTTLYQKIWPAQSILFIYFAVVLGILSLFVQAYTLIVDAYGLTVQAEKIKVIQKFGGFILLLIMFVFQSINLVNFFMYNYLVLLLLIFGFMWMIKSCGFDYGLNKMLSMEQILSYGSEFYQYCYPLFAYTLMSLIVNFFDRWILQKYGGSIQQGFYSLSYQIGMICSLFTGAMSPLILREFSIAHEKNDIPKIKIMFRKYLPVLYSVSAFFSCFIAVQAKNVTTMLGGSSFSQAIIPVMIMAFYPIHQTYGQLSGSVFFATGRTALYRNIGIIFLLAGLPITYLLVAPADRFGFDTGATGLAVKMVLINILSVNVLLFYISKILELSFWKYFIHQVVSFFVLFITAKLAVFISKNLDFFSGNVFIGFLFVGVLYTGIVALVAYLFPDVFGIKKEKR